MCRAPPLPASSRCSNWSALRMKILFDPSSKRTSAMRDPSREIANRPRAEPSTDTSNPAASTWNGMATGTDGGRTTLEKSRRAKTAAAAKESIERGSRSQERESSPGPAEAPVVPAEAALRCLDRYVKPSSPSADANSAALSNRSAGSFSRA